jgi:glycosyltransferase involved in cell wall biosynthesis
MRLTLVIASLGAGGAERVFSIMGNWWAGHGAAVTLVTLAEAGTDFYALDPRVERIGLGAIKDSCGFWDALRNNAVRIRTLRAAIVASTPDAVISFMDTVNVVTLLAGAGLRVPVIVSERVDPRQHPIGRAWSMLRRWTYPRAAAVVAQSTGVAEWISHTLHPRRCEVIPNPVPTNLQSRAATPGTESLAPVETRALRVIAMGRLVHQKGFDLLLRAFAGVAAQHLRWRLSIVGDGPDRAALESLANELGIAERVDFTGRVTEPESLLCRSDLFVLSSRYEGFPNALLEAMACGLACISFDCPSGPADIIRDRIDGILVPPQDVAALADALDCLMRSDAERRRLASRAPEVTERFGIGRVMNAWNELIASVRGAASVAGGSVN